MEKSKKMIWILHAGINHPSPYFYNFCKELDKIDDYSYVIDPNLPLDKNIKNGIVYFNRLKRFYKSDDINTALEFLNNIDSLKNNGWKIVWTIHNFFPIDRELSDIDYYVTSEFIKKCDKVFTVSSYMKKSIKKNYGINAINHGVGPNLLNNNKINEEVKKLNKSKEFTFTFIGNIYKYKMLDQIIENFNKLKDCRLIIAGSESKNANVNMNKLINNNKNIIFIDSFIDKNDWKRIASLTDCFISLYDLYLPAFKYGFFPSNFINISKTNIRCISPKSIIFDEMICKRQMIYYDFDDENGLLNAMKKAQTFNNNIVRSKIKYNYDWQDVVKTFIDGCNEMF